MLLLLCLPDLRADNLQVVNTNGRAWRRNERVKRASKKRGARGAVVFSSARSFLPLSLPFGRLANVCKII